MARICSGDFFNKDRFGLLRHSFGYEAVVIKDGQIIKIYPQTRYSREIIEQYHSNPNDTEQVGKLCHPNQPS